MFKKYIMAFLISMVPLVELRGGVPVGTGWGIPWHWCLLVCMLGNMIPVPFIFFFARKLLVWGSDKKVIGKFCSFCLKKGEKGGKKLQQKAGKSVYVALLLFVGIPLPGTGAWTGTLAASILDLDFKKSIIAVVLGVLLAGLIMTIASQGVASLFA
ncbi:small multi-drug export protein [Ruminococcus sp. FC2018]|uniref:COG2426 family protein n=1 Tax=Ruminococcus sp. FC2018 TaxID=1410617 RepID=UPI0004918A17|nr:small multi-drug export protein [Ruminococcus sp. FC2018]